MNSAFDERYDIRLADYNDINMIMDFIGTNWKKDHILARDRKIFEYEFLENGGKVNFLLAINRETNTLESINGFLKASHNPKCMDIWGVMWKTRPNNFPLLGIELLRRRKQLTGCRAEIGVGDNPKTAIPMIRKIFKRYTDKMNHYYMLSGKKDYKIASVSKNYIPNTENGKGEVIKFNSIDELTKYYDFKKNTETIPHKDDWYINHKYFQNVAYKYEVCGIKVNNKVSAIFIYRKEYIENRYIIRIIDYIGEQSAISEIGGYFKHLLNNKDCEYIDFYNLGFNDEHLKKAGFILRNKDDTNIIPNYFHPFIKENIDIWVSSNYPDTLFFKGDSDQDRAN